MFDSYEADEATITRLPCDIRGYSFEYELTHLAWPGNSCLADCVLQKLIEEYWRDMKMA